MMLIKKPVLAVTLSIALGVALPTISSASESGGLLQSAHNDVSNIASLQRGARNFVNYCLGCHSDFGLKKGQPEAEKDQTVLRFMLAPRVTGRDFTQNAAG